MLAKTTLRQIGWVTASLGLTSLLVGCGQMTEPNVDEPAAEGAALAFTNGLAMVNGLSATNGLAGSNGLAGTNGLALANGLAMTNGLSSTTGLMTTDAGRRTVAYLAKCALAANDTLVKQDQYGQSYTFAGGLGLCPKWKYGGVTNDWSCQEYVSACVMAHLNTAGVHVPIWLDASISAIGWGMNPAYPYQEGTFFGNLLTTGLINHAGTVGPVGYYCDGDGFARGSSGVVAGRIGDGPNDAYRNPWGDGTLCKNVCVGQYSAGTAPNPDGYVNCGPPGVPTFNSMITVWRSNTYTPVFDSGYRYGLTPVSGGGLAVEVASGSQANGAAVQQWSSTGLAQQRFALLDNGNGTWRVVMAANTSKCVDNPAGASANGTQMQIWDCNGAVGQQWTIVPDVQSGAFFMKNKANGKCLDVPGGTTAWGARMEIWDCWGGANQKFRIRAVP